MRAHDTDEHPRDCDECGEPMEWRDAYPMRVHEATGEAECGLLGLAKGAG